MSICLSEIIILSQQYSIVCAGVQLATEQDVRRQTLIKFISQVLWQRGAWDILRNLSKE